MSEKINPEIAVVSIDIGKNSFHVVGHDQRGAIVLRQKWSRGQLEARLANLPPSLHGGVRTSSQSHASGDGAASPYQTNRKFMMMPPDDRWRRKKDRWAATLGTARPIPLWRLRSGPRSSPIDQCSDFAPRTSRTLTMLNLAPSSVFRSNAIVAATAIALHDLLSSAGLDRLRLEAARYHRP